MTITQYLQKTFKNRFDEAKNQQWLFFPKEKFLKALQDYEKASKKGHINDLLES